jgi:hypothetical protein
MLWTSMTYKKTTTTSYYFVSKRQSELALRDCAGKECPITWRSFSGGHSKLLSSWNRNANDNIHEDRKVGVCFICDESWLRQVWRYGEGQARRFAT